MSQPDLWNKSCSLDHADNFKIASRIRDFDMQDKLKVPPLDQISQVDWCRESFRNVA